MKIFLKNNWVFILISLFFNILFLMSFYPGILSFDSYSQWHQLSEFKFNDWHPAYHTIIMWGITRIWYSPASIVLFQNIFFTSVLIYGLISFKKSGIKESILSIISVIVSSNLIIGMMQITLWKDILYGDFILLLTIYIFNLIQTDGHWIKNKLNSTILGITLANILLLRHNGFPVAVISLLALFLKYKFYKKYFFQSTLIFIIFVIIIKIPIYNLFRVDTSNSQSYGVAFIHPIAAHIDQGTKFTVKEKEFLSNIYPLANGWQYSCHDATILFYKGLNFIPVVENPSYLGKMLIKKTITNPITTIRHFICLSSFTWNIFQNDQVYLETVLFDSFNPENHPDWMIYKELTSPKSIIPQLKVVITNFGNFLLKVDKYKIIWRPALYMYVFLIPVGLLYSKNKNYWVLSIPTLSQTVVIMGTAQLEALRYQYPIYLISLIFTIPLIFLFIEELKNQKDKEKNNR